MIGSRWIESRIHHPGEKMKFPFYRPFVKLAH